MRGSDAILVMGLATITLPRSDGDRQAQRLGEWLADAKPGLMASFASSIARDQAAVKAALIEPWSNGQTEGQNTKLKLVKRQMYGRANLDLLLDHVVETVARMATRPAAAKKAPPTSQLRKSPL
jgi:transposase